MLKKTIKYTDFEGVERTEDFYFNISKAESVELMSSEAGGMDKYIARIIETTDNKKIVEIFKDLILRAYGQKSLDGRRFVKSKELSDEFAQTNAYVELFMELATDADAAATFVNAILPQATSSETPNLPVKD